MDDHSIYRSAGRNTPAVPPDEDSPVTPLPPLLPEDQMPDLFPDRVPFFPPPPIDSAFGQPPFFDSARIPDPPLPPVIVPPDAGHPPRFTAAPASGGTDPLPTPTNSSHCTPADAKRSGVYSIYLLGTWNRTPLNLQIRVVEDIP